MWKTFINISLMKSWWLKLCNFWWISIILWQKCKQMDLMMSHYLNKHRSDQSLFSSWLCKPRGYWSVYSVNCQIISYPLLIFLKQKWLIANGAHNAKKCQFCLFPKWERNRTFSSLCMIFLLEFTDTWHTWQLYKGCRKLWGGREGSVNLQVIRETKSFS